MHGPDHDHLYAGSYSDADLAWWADRIREWSLAGQDVFVYFNNDGNANAVRNARTLHALLAPGGSLAGLVSPRSAAHSQGSQGKGAEKHDDSDYQQVQQAFGDHADDAQRDRHDYQEQEQGNHRLSVS
jgi:hypothetical protein